MLWFKKNIYLPATEVFDREDPEPLFDPYNFIMQALVADRGIFHSLKQIDLGEAVERLATLFPHASRFGGIDILNSISKKLLEAIVQSQHMAQNERLPLLLPLRYPCRRSRRV